MQRFQVSLDSQTALFFQKVAEAAGRSTEQVLSDALFKLAGELSLQALHKAEHR